MPPAPTRAQLENRINDLEQQLRQKNAHPDTPDPGERYRALFEQAADAILLVGVETEKLVDFNHMAHASLGYTRKEFEKLHISEFDIYSSTGKIKNHIKKIIETGGNKFETKHKTKEGKALDILVSSRLIKIDGKSYIQSICRDITDRKEAEAALKESEKKNYRLYKMIRMMADNVPDMIWAKDLNDQYLFVNQAMCDNLLMCNGPENAVGKTDIYFAQRERESGHNHTFGEICVESDIIVREKHCPCRFLEDGAIRGKYLALDVHKAPLIDDNNNVVGTVGCGRDVTREKENEKLLAKYRKDLETLVEKRTSELMIANQKLKEDEKKLKESKSALEDQTKNLQEANAALKVLLKHREEDKEILGKKVVENVNKLIMPYLEKIKNSQLSNRQATYFDIIESNLNDIISPFLNRLSTRFANFTPTEIRVAGMVREGKTTKEIADVMSSSTGAINFHRNNIRRKLGLQQSGTNLRSYLMSLS